MQFTNALTEGPDGFESTFAVNVLANHLFVRLLQDGFTAPARIVITTSDTHFGDFKHNMGMVPGPVWKSPDILARTGAFPEPHTAAAGRTAYSTSKLATIYLVHEYARRLPAGIDAVAYNPGFVPGTGLARNAGPLARFAMRRVLPLMALTPFASSRTGAGRCLADVVLGTRRAPTGSYIDRRRAARASEESYDPQRERELWDASERFTARDVGVPRDQEQPTQDRNSSERPLGGIGGTAGVVFGVGEVGPGEITLKSLVSHAISSFARLSEVPSAHGNPLAFSSRNGPLGRGRTLSRIGTRQSLVR